MKKLNNISIMGIEGGRLPKTFAEFIFEFGLVPCGDGVYRRPENC